jgi:hypothetical protein
MAMLVSGETMTLAILSPLHGVNICLDVCHSCLYIQVWIHKCFSKIILISKKMTHQLCAKKHIGLAKLFTLKTLNFLHDT